MKTRCSWANDISDEVMIEYHDNEYGKRLNTNRDLFELLSLELLQTGLSWRIVLTKRSEFNKCFCNFELNIVSLMTNDDIIKMLNNDKLIRHRLKLEAIINNAKIIENKQIILADYIERMFCEYQYEFAKCAKQFKNEGFKFIGPSVIESLFKALGYIEGHDEICYKYRGEVNE